MPLHEVVIPFRGFYCTEHQEILDWAVEDLCRDHRGDLLPVIEEVNDAMDWRALQLDYARWYVGELARLCPQVQGLQLQQVRSPREYNFVNDQLVGTLPDDVVVKLYAAVDKELLQELVHKQFTSYDGFISYYAGDLEEWPDDPRNWDAVQLGVLLETALLQFVQKRDLCPWEMAEEDRGNGVFVDMVCAQLSEELLAKVQQQVEESENA